MSIENKTIKPISIINKLTPQQGKVLRYIVDRGSDPTGPLQTINKISWSDIPHSLLESKKCFNDLVNFGLIAKKGKKYVATKLGNSVIAKANNKKLWQTPPSPHIINKLRK